MKNILTFDIEEWYHSNYPNVGLVEGKEKSTNLEANIKEILYLCEKYQAKATFFVLGEVAEIKPHLVTLIQEKGHEIASHGYKHELVYNMTPEKFKEDLQKSIQILESIIKEKILGYRAPSWSFNKKTQWAYQIMADLGLKYSASIFPVKTFLYGMPKAPRFPYFVHLENNKKILEISTSTIRLFKKNIAFSGGAFFRFLPLSLIKMGIRRVNKEGQPAILYLHPREIDKNQPRIKLPLKENTIHYWGISKTKNKLEEILKNFSFGSIKSELIDK